MVFSTFRYNCKFHQNVSCKHNITKIFVHYSGCTTATAWWHHKSRIVKLSSPYLHYQNIICGNALPPIDTFTSWVNKWSWEHEEYGPDNKTSNNYHFCFVLEGKNFVIEIWLRCIRKVTVHFPHPIYFLMYSSVKKLSHHCKILFLILLFII